MAHIGRGRRLLIPGPVLLGFAEFFDRSYGDPQTPRPYPKVTPSRIGHALLPFPCPHCGAVKSEPVNPKKSGGYSDRQRGFSWCPACRGRYVVNAEGTPLVSKLPTGATYAPAVVERDGRSEVLGASEESGLHMLGTA